MDQTAPQKITVAAICDALGRKIMAERLGVGISQISNACVDNRFPARWFAVVRALCAQAEIECPEFLFKFIAVSHADEDPNPAAAQPAPEEDAA